MVGKSKSRATKSRAQELQFMLGFLRNPDALVAAFHANPAGNGVPLEGIAFVWGDISLLLPNIKPGGSKLHSPEILGLKPQFICHLWNLNKKQRLLLKRIETSSGSVFSEDAKADLLLVDCDNHAKYISYKDAGSLAKLSQKGKKKQLYGTAELRGGITLVDLSSFYVPNSFDYRSTHLDEESFLKLETANQKRAYIRCNYPNEWKEKVDEQLDLAYQCLEEFGKSISENKENLIEFVKQTFIGRSNDLENYHIVFGDALISISRFLSRLENSNFIVETEWYATDNKMSLIVRLNIGGTRYTLTKIEPAFDGGYDIEASQSKGIQYYFQQWPDNASASGELDYKNLLLDLGK
jgi:hypothetical protein